MKYLITTVLALSTFSAEALERTAQEQVSFERLNSQAAIQRELVKELSNTVNALVNCNSQGKILKNGSCASLDTASDGNTTPEEATPEKGNNNVKRKSDSERIIVYSCDGKYRRYTPFMFNYTYPEGSDIRTQFKTVDIGHGLGLSACDNHKETREKRIVVDNRKPDYCSKSNYQWGTRHAYAAIDRKKDKTEEEKKQQKQRYAQLMISNRKKCYYTDQTFSYLGETHRGTLSRN